MAEYKDVETLKKLIDELIPTESINNSRYINGYRDALLSVKSLIYLQPSADVAPVNHGEWLHNKKKNIWGDWVRVYSCSVCGKLYKFKGSGVSKIFKYCPNCGAKMEEYCERD
jgi:hypothetical protein